MKIYRLSMEYFDIGHREVMSIISIWRMLKDGTIEERITKMPNNKDRHTEIWPSIWDVIAEGRCDIGRKECSCQYYGEGKDQQRDWIKFLLKEKFGQDIRIFDF